MLIICQKNGCFVAPITLTKNNIQFHLENLTKSLALHSSNYENLIILGDFNVSIDNSYMAGFCDTYDLRSLIMEPTCYKNPENPTCIDLI